MYDLKKNGTTCFTVGYLGLNVRVRKDHDLRREFVRRVTADVVRFSPLLSAGLSNSEAPIGPSDRMKEWLSGRNALKYGVKAW